jgi:hypothetical protein
VARDKPVSQFNPTGVALELGPAVCRSRERLVNVAVYPLRDSLEVGVDVGSGRVGRVSVWIHRTHQGVAKR